MEKFFTYILNPLNQFEIKDFLYFESLGNIHISITNIGFYLTLSLILIMVMNFLSTNLNRLLSNNWSISQESLFFTVYSIVVNQINPRKGQVYFPFVFGLFIFILINNLIGLVPYSFASTSHFVLTFWLSFTVVIGSTILGFLVHGLNFFSILVPAGCPIALLPLLVGIEFISYMSRNISLGLRLGANIMSGHMLLHILSGFTYQIMTSGIILFFVGLIPLAFIIAFSGLEFAIAFIQSQVFIVLACSYIKNGLDLH